jgi:hypothetical protein
MATDPQSGTSQRRARPHHHHPRRPPGFWIWVLVALACIPAVGTVLYSAGGPAWILTAIFFGSILLHYFRLAAERRPLDRTIYSGACLLSLFLSIYVTLTGPFGVLGFDPCAICALSIFGAIPGGLAGFLTAVLIEATRSVCVGTWILRRKRRTKNRRTDATSTQRRNDDVLPLERPPSNFLPRRFGVRGMLVLVTLASFLMALMQALRVPAGPFLAVIVFVAGVLSGQVLLFRGRKPLAASAWVGGVLLPVEGILAAFMSHLWRNGGLPDLWRLIGDNLVGSICTVPAGIALGTVVGVFAGGAYAGMDEFCRRLFGGWPRLELLSATADDIDMLLAWVSGPQLFQRWSAGQLEFPMDRQQFSQRFEAVADQLPVRMAFKAVETRTGNMVGYVELGHIGHQRHVAFVEFPLVAPDIADRDLLSVLLLRAVAEKAFELGFRQLGVRLHSREDELDRCCLRAWDGVYNYQMANTKGFLGARYFGWLSPWG